MESASPRQTLGTLAAKAQEGAAPATLIPALAIGNILRLSVQQNNPGSGVLLYGGYLFSAELPPSLLPGDSFLARVETSGDQLLLRVLDLTRAGGSTPGDARTARVQETAIESALTQQLRAVSKVFVPSAPGAAANDTGDIDAAKVDRSAPLPPAATNTLVETDAAQTALPDRVATLLKSIRAGDLGRMLDESAQVLRKEALRLSLQGFPKEVRLALEPLLITDAKRPAASLQGISSDTIEKLRGDGAAANVDKQTLLKAVLKIAQNEMKTATPTEALERVTAALLAAEPGEQPGAPDTREVKITVERYLAAARAFELGARAQEALQQLNPLLHGIGEPALLLFPFLRDGILSHAGIFVQPDREHESSHRFSQNSDESTRDQGSGGEPFKQLSLTVPLSHLGSVQAEVAYRANEIMLRVVVESEESAAFIDAQIETLRSSLALAGLTLVEYGSTVQQPGLSSASSSIPAWVAPARAVVVIA